MNRLSRSPRTLHRRPLWVALLGLVLLLGTLDYHPTGESHPLHGLAQSSEYSPEAAHPEQPVHIEEGRVVERPHCPVCLQRQQLGGLHLAASTELAPPAARDLLTVAADRTPAGRALLSSGARAPPLS